MNGKRLMLRFFDENASKIIPPNYQINPNWHCSEIAFFYQNRKFPLLFLLSANSYAEISSLKPANQALKGEDVVNETTNQIALSKDQLIGQFCSHANSFIGYAFRFTHDRDMARDFFQEACLRFLTVSATFRAYPLAAQYICRTIFTLAMENLKKQSRLVFVDRLPEMVCEPEIEWQREMMFEKFREVTETLPLRDSRLLMIHMLPGIRLREKSKLMGLPTSTYRYQVSRVISKLRKRLTTVKHQRIGNQCQIGGN
jgi:RNA polymerase sigma factor (sigma-70 family)